MCNFLSAIVKQDGEILCGPEHTDSHEDLMAMYNIRDGLCQEGKFVRVEFIPPMDRSLIHNTSKWALKVDENSTPDWFDHEEMHRKFSSMVKDMMISEEKKLLLGGCWILLDGAKIEKVNNATIKFMVGNAQVERMHDSSRVGRMCDSSQVEVMRDSSQVRVMWDSSRVERMHDSSWVERMYDSSRVEVMRDSSQVRVMCDSSQVEVMYGSSQVEVMRDSSLIIKDHRNH